MWTLIILIALLIPLIAVIGDSPMARAFSARMERERQGDLTGVDERVAALEAEVERLTGEVERLSEQGTFLQRLLEPRTLEAPDAPSEGTVPLPPSERRR